MYLGVSSIRTLTKLEIIIKEKNQQEGKPTLNYNKKVYRRRIKNAKEFKFIHLVFGKCAS